MLQGFILGSCMGASYGAEKSRKWGQLLFYSTPPLESQLQLRDDALQVP